MSERELTFYFLDEDELREVRLHFKEISRSFTEETGNLYERTFKLHGCEVAEEEIVPLRVGKKLLGPGKINLAELLRGISVAGGVTLSTAESCTGGDISSLITDVPGSSDYYLGGVIAYDNKLKIEILGVKEDSIGTFGAVSREVAEEMAEGVSSLTGSDFALAVTGIAGPSGGSREKAVGTVWFGFKTPGGMKSERYVFSGNRLEVKRQAASWALFKIIRSMEKGEVS